MTRPYYIEYIDTRDPGRAPLRWRAWTGAPYPDLLKADAACRHLQAVADECRSYLTFRVTQKQTKGENT